MDLYSAIIVKNPYVLTGILNCYRNGHSKLTVLNCHHLFTYLLNTSPGMVQIIVMSIVYLLVCLSVCPLTYLINYTASFCPFHQLSLNPGPPLMALRYVMYFRFCGWRHVFNWRSPWRVMCMLTTRQRFHYSTVMGNLGLGQTKSCRNPLSNYIRWLVAVSLTAELWNGPLCEVIPLVSVCPV